MSGCGVENMVISRYRWLANTLHAHITNQSTMVALRDLGRAVEEIGRMNSWGTHPLSKAEHRLLSPTMMNDLPQAIMEPLLFKTACARGIHLQKDRVFIMGDAAHRHPPSNGLGCNTLIQIAFNIAGRLAAVVKGRAGAALLDSHSRERTPVSKQIVNRANQSIGEFVPIFPALGMTGGTDIDKIKVNMDARCDATSAGEAQRATLREEIAFKTNGFGAHGVEMNQRHASDAVVTDGHMEPAFDLDAEMHDQPNTRPGARLPQVWLHDPAGKKHSMPDRGGRGQFTLFTGIGGEAWAQAAAKVGTELGLPLTVRMIGPRRPDQEAAGTRR